VIRPSPALPLLLLVAAAALGWNLGGHRLLDPDEGRNAEVAREMVQSGDYLVPHLDGLPYLDKPIVYFAAAAAAMELLGPTELAARLPAYLATLGTIALLVWFARRRSGEATGWLAGIAYATMVLPLAYAHVAIFDSLLTLCTTAAIIAFFEDRTALAWLAMGVGAITKGPIALAIPLVVAVVERLVTGRPLQRLVSLRGLALFALTALPWFLAVTRKFPEFPSYAFVTETAKRFTTASFHRTAPVWYYLPIVLLGAFPWIVPAGARLGRWREAWATRTDPGFRESAWLACWVLAPLVLLTANHSKLPQYVLPLMPAIALAAARTLAATDGTAAWRWYAAIAPLLGAVFSIVPSRITAPISLTAAERAAMGPTGIAIGGALIVSAAAVALAALRRDVVLAAFGYGLVAISIPLSSAALLRAVGDDRSAWRLASAIAPVLDRAAREGRPASVLGVATYPPSLPFYLRATISVATATADELTSNYIATYQERYRSLHGSPLKPAGFWQTTLDGCAVPTVFVAHADDRVTRQALAALPLIGEDHHHAAYGPCTPRQNGKTVRAPDRPSVD
jgi:4-amino-4-deoxy-L-arabinose transferase-like glycosyltransferase